MFPTGHVIIDPPLPVLPDLPANAKVYPTLTERQIAHASHAYAIPFGNRITFMSPVLPDLRVISVSDDRRVVQCCVMSNMLPPRRETQDRLGYLLASVENLRERIFTVREIDRV